jgi:hypothetical protein
MGATCLFARGGLAHTVEFFATGLSLSAAPLAANTKNTSIANLSRRCTKTRSTPMLGPEYPGPAPHLKSLKRRAGLPVRRLCAAAPLSSALISAMSRNGFRQPE